MAELDQCDYPLSPDQAVKLVALANLLRTRELTIRGDDPKNEKAAQSLIVDVGEELALQFGGLRDA